MSVCRICVLILCINTSLSQKNNVCKNFMDYLNIDFNKNCWYNPDLFSTAENIAHNHGFEFQNHVLETEDGYNLTIFRIQDKFSSAKKQPVLLHHGIMSDAMCFLSQGNHSLALYLSKNGYDVWLANHRGNNYSPGHSRLKMSDPQFWNFSFHEIALYDIPAVLEHIAKVTNVTRTIYIGHSMGTTIGFIYASLKNDHADKYLKAFIAMSPIASMKYAKLPLKPFIPILHEVAQGLLSNNITVLYPHPERITGLVVSFCRKFPEACAALLRFFNGDDGGEALSEDVMASLSYMPSRTPVKCFMHYMQIILSRRFQFYDYSPDGNLEKYNSTVPPTYDLSKISIPVHLFYALNDNFVSYQDVKWIFSELATSEKSMNLVPENGKIKFNHMNFLMAKDIELYLYKPLVRVIKSLQTR